MKKAMMLLMLSALVMIGTQQSLLAQPKGEAAGAAKAPAPTTREMSLLCWQEFGEFVPGRIRTVLVPFGSLEPHGVVPTERIACPPRPWHGISPKGSTR